MPGVSTAASSDRRVVVSILDRDVELAAAVPVEQRSLARRVMTGRLVGMPAGATPVIARANDDAWGAYLCAGIVVRATRLGRVELPELLGPTEVLVFPAASDGVVSVTEALTVIESAAAVILGRNVAEAIARWPQILTVLEQRSNAQRQRAATMGAIAHLPNVEVRLLAVLWHIAESWGHVGRHGTIVPFAFTHEMLGRFVAARRPTVSLALQRLDLAGLVHRRDDGLWLLPPGSDAALRARLGSELPPAPAVLRSAPTAPGNRLLDVRARAARGRAKELAEEASALNAQARQLERRLAARHRSG